MSTDYSLWISNSPFLSDIPSNPSPETPEVYEAIQALQDPPAREEALLFLAKNRSIRDDMALLLWHAFGVTSILMQEIVAVYPLMATPLLTDEISHRLCNALVLLQTVATHPDTKKLLIKAKITAYIPPLLNNSNLDKPHEYIRLTSLGILGALVKNENEEAIQFILKNGVFPSFLHCMEIGTELTKTVASYIIHKILSNADGLQYCIVLADRFYIISSALGKMLENVVESGRLGQENSKRLLKHIIWCYYSLSHRPRACDGLKLRLPGLIKDSRVIDAICDDQTTVDLYMELLRNIANGYIATTEQVNRLNSRYASHFLP